MYQQAEALREERFRHYKFDEHIEDEISKLRALNNWRSLLALCSDYALIAISIAACYFISFWLYPIALVLIGARQRGISSILHETSHGISARNKALRSLLGTVLTAYPIFQTYYAYNISHVRTHHVHLGRATYDPDLRFFCDQRVFEVQHPVVKIIRTIILPLLGWRTFAYLKYLISNRLSADDNIGEIRVPRTLIEKRRREYIWFTVFWVSIVCAFIYYNLLFELLIFWVLPYLTAFQIIGWYIELSEHCTVIEGKNVDLYMSSNRKSRGLELFLTGIHNDHHHLDHHLDPTTPFWNLPEARKIRLRDSNYAEIDARTGGLFTRGPNGEPSAMQRLLEQNYWRYEEVRCPDSTTMRPPL